MDFDRLASVNEQAIALLEAHFGQHVVVLPSGERVAVRTTGSIPFSSDQPVVVLLHGIGSGAASWLRVAVQLGSRAQVVAWDAPGYGESTPLAQDKPCALDYAQRLRVLLGTLQVKACVLVGHSLGCLTAAAFASAAGEQVVTRLVLLSPARGYGAADRAELRQKVLETRIQSLHRLGIEGMALEAPKRMLSPAADASARAWVQWNAARLNAAGYVQAVHLLCGDDIGRYRTVSAPVEVHTGDADVVTTPEDSQLVARQFNASFSLIAGAGHASPIEQPTVVASRLATAAALSPETSGHE